MPPQQVIIFIIGTVAILFGAYYATYYIGMKASGQTRAGLRNRNIAVLDRYSIARDKCFCVVEIAGKVYIVGVTNNSMTLLDTYDAETFAEMTKDSGGGAQTPWGDTPVGRYGNKLTKKVVAFVAAKTGRLPKDETGGSPDPYHTPGNEKPAEKTTFEESMKNAENKAKDEGMAEDG